VIHEAQFHDPRGVRTLGVITKPDLADHKIGGKPLSLAQNVETLNKSRFGWVVVRNRAAEDGGTAAGERDYKETQFFQSGSWSIVSKELRGVDSLREKLG
jgi:hypothetical protein